MRTSSRACRAIFRSSWRSDRYHGHVPVPAHQDHVPHRHRELPVDLAALRHVGHPAPGMLHLLAENPHRPVVAVDESHDRLDQGRLARPVRARECPPPSPAARPGRCSPAPAWCCTIRSDARTEMAADSRDHGVVSSQAPVQRSRRGAGSAESSGASGAAAPGRPQRLIRIDHIVPRTAAGAAPGARQPAPRSASPPRTARRIRRKNSSSIDRIGCPRADVLRPAQQLVPVPDQQPHRIVAAHRSRANGSSRTSNVGRRAPGGMRTVPAASGSPCAVRFARCGSARGPRVRVRAYWHKATLPSQQAPRPGMH